MDFETEPTDDKPTDKRGRPSRYPFKTMEVDYSFFIENKRGYQMSPICAYWNKKLAPKRFIARHTDNEGKRILKAGVVGCRVYRVA